MVSKNILIMIEYVCGFAFSEDKQNVLLIEKDRPEWQAGKLNGVGGKIEEIDRSEKINPQNYPLYAMIREFKEEVGIQTSIPDWKVFAIMEGDNSKVYCFRTFSNRIFQKKQMESEYPTIIPCEYIGFQKTVPNVNFLVPMALYTNELFTIKCQIKGGNDATTETFK
jgi:8-oxo-dGTP diphosphatase